MSMGTNWDPGDYQEPAQSGIGVASFVLSLFAGLSFVGVMFYATVLFMQHGDNLDEESPEMLLLGGIFIFSIVLNVLAMVLGLVGLVQPNRKRVFALLGVIFSALLFLGGGALVIYGQIAEQ